MKAGHAKHRVSLLGCVIDALTFSETLDEIDRLIRDGRPVQHCVVNAAKIALVERDPRLREIVSSCALVNADGQSVVWAARILGRPLPERVAGVDLFPALLGLAEERGYGVYLLGGTPDVVAATAARAQREHPALRIAGHHDGYFGAGDTESVVAEIRAAHPEILFVGMPSPRKEYWLAEHLESLRVPFSMGVGGSFDVYAGKTSRAPTWVQRIGFEWAYRLSQEPTRMWKRYLVGNATFLWLLLKECRRDGIAWSRRRDDRTRDSEAG